MPDTPHASARARPFPSSRTTAPSSAATSGPTRPSRPRCSRARLRVARAALIDAVIPRAIRRKSPLALGEPRTEGEALSGLRRIAEKNQVFKSYIGQGYYGTYTPGVILRNVFQNPAWYTAYTPYQPEISQGRLEALLNFQTMVTDLTGMAIANASMLDEATAAAEAMTLACARRSARPACSRSPTTCCRRPSTWCARAPRRSASRCA